MTFAKRRVRALCARQLPESAQSARISPGSTLGNTRKEVVALVVEVEALAAGAVTSGAGDTISNTGNWRVYSAFVRQSTSASFLAEISVRST